ncbi:MAG: hypothetical protein ABS948_06570 [Solibacillus sp.]
MQLINFLQRKNQKQDTELAKLFTRAHSFDERLALLLSNRQLQVDDHKLFLAFLSYLDEQQIQPKQIFRDVIELPKHAFEVQYEMNWAQVVKLACTFLVILKEHNPEAYEAFVAP